MKRIFITLFFVLLFAVRSYAGTYSITFSWDANTEPDLAGYRLYTSAVSELYLPTGYKEINKDATSDVMTGITTETPLYFVIRAIDESGNESGNSNEVVFTPDEIAPESPNEFRITIIIKQN